MFGLSWLQMKLVTDVQMLMPCALQTLMDVYSKLDKCNEYIPLSRNEFYFTTLRGRWCFLPALPFIEVSDLDVLDGFTCFAKILPCNLAGLPYQYVALDVASIC